MTLLTDRSGRFSWLKTVTLAALFVPAMIVVFRYWTNDLGPLPFREANHVAGDWAVRFLLVALLLTPAQRILSWSKLALVRRMAGVGAFAYAALHVILYVADIKFNLGLLVSEIVQRLYLTIGFVSLVGLSLLAATSTDWAIRKLGARWKQLHRLVYGIAILALLHFFMQSKIDASEATLMAGLFSLLMIYRLAISRRLSLSPLVLAVSAMAAGAMTAVIEFTWYGLATGIDPWRLLSANVLVQYGLRPAPTVLLVGLSIAAIPLIRNMIDKRSFPARTQTA